MRSLNEYEIRIRTEKHGVYHDHGPFSISAKSKQKAICVAMKHLRIRIQRMLAGPDKAKVAALKTVVDDTIGSEVSVIATRIR